MKKIIARTLPLLFCLPCHASFAAFSIDASAASTSPITGLWWSAKESGWGVTLIQQYDAIFVTMFVYDDAGNPVWYVASNCIVAGDGCNGDLHKTAGGTTPLAAWSGSSLSIRAVGTISLKFSDYNNGTMSYVIDGASNAKVIARQVFRAAPAATALAWSAHNSNTYRWADADAYCKKNTINGLTGWRLPTQPELTAYAQSGKGAGNGGTWSSTPTQTPTYHYYVSLNGTAGGALEASDSSYLYVQCVR